MDVEELQARALSYRTHRAAEKAEKELAEADRDWIAEAMRKAKKTVVEVGGVRIIAKRSRRFVSLDKAKEHLARNRKVLKSVIREEIDKKAWDAAVKTGDLTNADTVACTVEEPCQPYVLVNDVAPAEG